jgi:hypothetical protein
MITADAPEAYGYTIFCDDIRAEVGGKLTYVGCYAGTMFAPTFPITLPKFCLGIVYMQQNDKIVLPIKIWVFLPGDDEDKPSIQAEGSPEDDIAAARAAREARVALGGSTEELGYATVYSQFAVAGFVLKQPGVIRVRAVRGDQLIRLGSLEVLRTTPGTSPPATPPSSA